jgi:hypothetical protein
LARERRVLQYDAAPAIVNAGLRVEDDGRSIRIG